MRIGSVVMTTGLYVSAFTPSLELMFFTFGIVVGKKDGNSDISAQTMHIVSIGIYILIKIPTIG